MSSPRLTVRGAASGLSGVGDLFDGLADGLDGLDGLDGFDGLADGLDGLDGLVEGVGLAMATCLTEERFPSLPTNNPTPSGATATVSPCGCGGRSCEDVARHVFGARTTREV
jgi:hypothetical protein